MNLRKKSKKTKPICVFLNQKGSQGKIVKLYRRIQKLVNFQIYYIFFAS